MSAAAESLVLGSGEQLALLEADEAGLPAQAYTHNEAAGKFTGDRIFSTNPKLYRAIVALLAREVPYREISEICSVSVNTVCGVCAREGVPIETIRERIARLGFDVAALTAEAARDILADPERRAQLNLKDLMIAHGIAFSNAQLASGGATVRLDNISAAKPGHDDYEAFVRGVIDVTATGLEGESRGAKEGLPAMPEAIEAGPSERVARPGAADQAAGSPAPAGETRSAGDGPKEASN